MNDKFKEWKRPIFDRNGWAYKESKLDRNPFNDEKQIVYINPYGWRCQYSEGLKLGDNVDIGCFSYLQAAEGIEIGDNVQIGGCSLIYSVNTENDTKGKIIIGENSLIGSFALILPNSVIPPNSKIPARSIINGQYIQE